MNNTKTSAEQQETTKHETVSHCRTCGYVQCQCRAGRPGWDGNGSPIHVYPLEVK